MHLTDLENLWETANTATYLAGEQGHMFSIRPSEARTEPVTCGYLTFTCHRCEKDLRVSFLMSRRPQCDAGLEAFLDPCTGSVGSSP